MDPFTITVNGRYFNVRPIEAVDQVLYEIYDSSELLTVIGLNEDAEWEANNNFDEFLAKSMGEEIDRIIN